MGDQRVINIGHWLSDESHPQIESIHNSHVLGKQGIHSYILPRFTHALTTTSQD